MFSALDCVAFVWYICRAVGLPPCAYTEASPGAGSLVEGEPSQSLGPRLLVSIERRMELLVISITFLFTHDNLMNFYFVLFCSNVIFVSIFIMYIFHAVLSLL